MGVTLLLAAPALAQTVLRLDGGVPEDEARYFEIPFQVPAGTQELEVRHDDLSGANILDWGLEEPGGKFRGWGGGNEEPAIVGVNASSRSYLTGPLPAGTWKVVVGKAKIAERPARYEVEIHLRNSPSLPPQPQRRPYSPAPPLKSQARWYAGDFHVHSVESGDARPELDELATFARSRGLDFVLVSDHNTTSHLDFLGDVQGRHPDLLLIPGMEFTTYKGHANTIGSTSFVDSRIGYEGRTLQAAVDAFHANGALFSINHPMMDLPIEYCIGCAWEHEIPANLDAVEIASSGWNTLGVIFTEPAIAFWDVVSARGIHAKALGGSDDHRAGVDLNGTQSPISEPSTMVFAEELSVDAIRSGIRQGRTVVKLQGIEDPMVELDGAGRIGDTIIASEAHLTARVTGGKGQSVRFVRNGLPFAAVSIPEDDFVYTQHVVARETADRWRAEVLVGGRPRTVTSNLWIQKTADAAPSPHEGTAEVPGPCGCSGTGAAPLLAGVLALAAAAWRRSRREFGNESSARLTVPAP